MPGFGPAPKANARGRHPSRDLTSQAARLPRNGRQGDPPAWPLGRQRRRESEIWTRLWRTPQAVAWEELGWADAVARYARVLVAAEQVNAQPVMLAEARQLEDRLGLSPLALLRLRWEIVEDAGSATEEGESVLSIRERLAAVE